MARTRKRTQPKRGPESEAAKRHRLLNTAAYDQLSNSQLDDEWQKRDLRGTWYMSRDFQIQGLRKDDTLKGTLSLQAYAAIAFTRSGRPPPYVTWDCEAQDTQTQQAKDYTARVERAKRAASHNNNLRVSFMTLAPELRNIVYLAVFSSAPTLVQNHPAHPFVVTREKDFYFGHEHALLRTCKSIRLDALPVWYGNRQYCFTQGRTHLKDNYSKLTFPFHVDQAMMGCLEKWATLLRDGRLDLIRDLHLALDCVEFTVKKGVFDIRKIGSEYQGDAASRIYGRLCVKGVPAVAKAILEMLGKKMMGTLTPSEDLAGEYRDALGLGTMATEKVHDDPGDA